MQLAPGPLDATLRLGPVANGDPNLVHVRRRLGERDLHRPLALGAWEEREVCRNGDEVGAGEGEPARELGEVEVVADRHADPAERRLHDRRRLGARREPELLAVPEMRLAVDGEQSVGPDDRCRVVDAPSSPSSAKPPTTTLPYSRGLLRPPRDHRAVCGLAQRSRLLHRLEDIAGRTSAPAGARSCAVAPDRRPSEPRVFASRGFPRVAHPGSDLRTRDSNGRHRPWFTPTPPTRQDHPPWSSPSCPPTSPS